jgi:pyrroline-5-carboxylate reductase
MDTSSRIAFVGGGNMALAIIGGLRAGGLAADRFVVVEPVPAQRERLARECGVAAAAAADASLAGCGLVVWAVKPQSFGQASADCRPWVGQALQLSIMAGVRCATIAQATGAAAIVRAMPNTPALIGRGVAGMFAVGGVDAAGRERAEQVLRATGSVAWVGREEDLDAVTALSGSGPAYVFYLLEAMVQAGVEMGLPAALARRLGQETFAGAAALAAQSDDSLQLLRERVTSRGGTTHAAITAMEDDGVKDAFVRAMHAAHRRAEELGRGG